MTQARPEVHTPSAAYHPGAGRHRQASQRVELPRLRSAMLIAETGSMIGTLPHLAVPRWGTAPAPRPETAEPDGPVRPANGHHGAGPKVTAEELTILTLMSNGMTLDSVAIRVSVSQRTLSRRLRCVCDRLGVAHPIQAIVWAARQGLL